MRFAQKLIHEPRATLVGVEETQFATIFDVHTQKEGDIIYKYTPLPPHTRLYHVIYMILYLDTRQLINEL